MKTVEMLCKARKAVHSGDYDAAEQSYRNLREIPQFRKDIDITLRFAYCAVCTGNYTEALSACKEALAEYRLGNDNGAAEAVEGLIRQIRLHMAEGEDAERKGVELPITLENAPEDAEVMASLMRAGKNRYLNSGDTLCRQGDPSSHVWFLTEGKIEVHVQDWVDTDVLTGHETVPYILGELGYFTGQRRAATLVARSCVKLTEIPVQDIHAMCARDTHLALGIERMFRERLVERVLSRHAIFERVNDVDRKRLAMAFKYCELGPGEVLIEPGVEHDGAYLIQSGCLLLKLPEHGQKGESGANYITSMFPGDMIHLGGLLRDYIPTYQVMTATPVRLLHLDREQFEPFTLRRPWIVQDILKHSRKPPDRQVIRPDEDYLWYVNRQIHLPEPS